MTSAWSPGICFTWEVTGRSLYSRGDICEGWSITIHRGGGGGLCRGYQRIVLLFLFLNLYGCVFCILPDHTTWGAKSTFGVKKYCLASAVGKIVNYFWIIIVIYTYEGELCISMKLYHEHSQITSIKQLTLICYKHLTFCIKFILF